MQPLHYLQDPAAKNNSITHAAGAPSNLDAATTMRSAETELQNTIELFAMVSEIAAPKPDLDLKHILKGFYKGQLLASKLRKSADKSLSQPGCSHSKTIYDLQLQKTIVLRMQPRHQATLTQPLQYVSQHHVANLHVSTHIPTPDDNNHAAIPMRSATTDSKTPKNYAPTSTPKAAWSHRYNAAKKKANRPQPQPHTGGTFSSSAAATLDGKMQGFVLRLPPQHKPHATFMQPLQCVSQHHVANLHVSTHMATPYDNNHAAIPMRSATTDSKTPKNYAPTSTPKAAWSHRYNAAKRQTDRSRNRTQEVPFIVGCSHFTPKNTRFRAPASSPTQAPCNIHAAITMRFAASRRKPARIYTHTHQHQMTTIMQPPQCDLQPQTPKHARTTHPQAHPKQLEATVTMRQKKRQTDRSRNRRTQEVPFIDGCSHFRRKNTRFRAPASSPTQAPCNIHAAITMRFAASRRKPARIYAHGNTIWQQSCSHSNAICNHRFQNTL